MKNKNTQVENKDLKGSKNDKYEKPKIKTESLTVVAAMCNGSSTAGGRKASVMSACTASKLMS